jgi:hypothetical protein
MGWNHAAVSTGESRVCLSYCIAWCCIILVPYCFLVLLKSMTCLARELFEDDDTNFEIDLTGFSRASIFQGCARGYSALRSSPRLISNSPLNTLPCLHACPINPVVYGESYPTKGEKSHLGKGFPLRCFQRLSRPHIATQHVPLV